MIKIEKIDDKNIRITDENGVGIYPAVFKAFVSKAEKNVNIRSTSLNIFKTINVPIDELEINGVVYSTQEDCVVELNAFIGNFIDGGDNQTTPGGEIPNLQQVTTKGNVTSRTITHAPAQAGNQSALLQQVHDIADEVEITEAVYNALTPEEQVQENYIII